MIAILAHSVASGRALADRLDLRPALVVFVHDARSVYGLDSDDTLLLWGEWWKTHEHREAHYEARLRKLLILEVNDGHSR